MYNQCVSTPLGEGVVQGRTQNGWLVRLPVSDKASLGLSNCWTPTAEVSGLWEFEESEIKVKKPKK